MFATATFDLDDEVFVVHIASIIPNSDVHPSWRAQIALLKADGVLTFVSSKYTNFADIFSKDLIAKLSGYTGINDYSIYLIERQKLFYKLIYSLGAMEQKTLKTCIENNLTNSFIRPSKSVTSCFILFGKKID